jgi:hypothetical protein
MALVPSPFDAEGALRPREGRKRGRARPGNEEGGAMGRARGWIPFLLAGFATMGAATPPSPAETRTLHYARDAAGRLVRVGDGTGMFRQYRLDPAGNVLGSRLRRMWHLSVKKPFKAAWALSVATDGAVEGTGVDAAGNVLEIGGTLVTDTGAPEGTLDVGIVDGASLGSFTLSGSSLKEDTGGPASLVLKGSGDGGTLLATAVRPTGAFEGFTGVFGSSKNSLKVGTAKSQPGPVALASEGVRGGASRLDGDGIAGFLLRDPKGKAYGVVTTDEGEVPVAATLKDGAKSVSVKSAKGSPVKVKLTGKR